MAAVHIGVFRSNFGHAVTQNLPVLVNQAANGANQFTPAFNLAAGPPLPTPVTVPSDGILPLSAGGGQPRIRPDKQRIATLDAWNLTVQRQLTNTMSLEVAYIGNKGTHVFAGNGPAYDVNQVAYSGGTAIVTTAGVVPSFCFTGSNAPNCPAGGTLTQNNRRPFFNRFTYPNFPDPTDPTKPLKCCGPGTLGNYFGNDASANYNALQVKLDKRFTQGLQFQANFTWSKAFNYSNDSGFLYSVAPQSSYGPDDYNRDKVFIFNGTYELPFGKGKRFAGGVGRAADLLIGGWQITNTTNIRSGLPFTPNASDCGSLVDTGPCLPDRIGSFDMGAGDFITPPPCSAAPSDPNCGKAPFVQYFTPVAKLGYPTAVLTPGTDLCTLARPTSGPFQMAGCGRPGLAGRNSFRGPGGWTDDLSVAKNFHMTERFTMQFRMDAINVFNHPVYGFSANDGATGGTGIDCSGNNGRILNIENGTTMRQLQFGLKLGF